MIIYRYEKLDGGGPYFTKNGILRTNQLIQYNDDTLSGCLSLDDLFEYFKNKQCDLNDCYIMIYDGELIYKSHHSKEVCIRKSTAKQLTFLKFYNII